MYGRPRYNRTWLDKPTDWVNWLVIVEKPKYFSKLDASSGYWQIKVDRESSNLLSFGKTIGRFHFKRLPYGIHSASEVFQRTVL